MLKSERDDLLDSSIVGELSRGSQVKLAAFVSVVSLGYAVAMFAARGFASRSAWVLAGTSIALAAASAFYSRGWSRAAGHLGTFAIWLCMTLVPILTRGFDAGAMFWAALVVWAAALSTPIQFIWVYTVLMTGSTISIHFVHPTDVIQFASAVGAVWFSGSIAFFYERSRLQVRKRLLDRAGRHPLTGLRSRRTFDELVAHTIATARRNASRFAVVFVDVNGLKSVNDRFGHLAGDQLLLEVAQRLREQTRSNEEPFHLSGDEFAIIALDVDETSIVPLRKRLLSIGGQMQWREHQMPVSISMGIAFGDGKSVADQLVDEADQKMYVHKQQMKSAQTIAS